jgi:hypothetical protein
MADYTKATNFTAKDGLPSGNAGKIVKGTEIDTELTAVSNAIASKADINSPTFTGTPAGPTASAGTNTTQLATTAFVTSALSAAYPIGSIYLNASSSSNPSVLLGFGTWEAFGAGRMMVGFNSGDALFDTLEETGGSKSASIPAHTHTATSVVTDPGHAHDITDGEVNTRTDPYFNWVGTGGASVGVTGAGTNTATTSITVATTVASTGVDGATANLPPYITVRMWKRTA